jgi:hypothetical protein
VPAWRQVLAWLCALEFVLAICVLATSSALVVFLLPALILAGLLLGTIGLFWIFALGYALPRGEVNFRQLGSALVYMIVFAAPVIIVPMTLGLGFVTYARFFSALSLAS